MDISANIDNNRQGRLSAFLAKARETMASVMSKIRGESETGKALETSVNTALSASPALAMKINGRPIPEGARFSAHFPGMLIPPAYDATHGEPFDASKLGLNGKPLTDAERADAECRLLESQRNADIAAGKTDRAYIDFTNGGIADNDKSDFPEFDASKIGNGAASPENSKPLSAAEKYVRDFALASGDLERQRAADIAMGKTDRTYIDFTNGGIPDADQKAEYAKLSGGKDLAKAVEEFRRANAGVLNNDKNDKAPVQAKSKAVADFMRDNADVSDKGDDVIDFGDDLPSAPDNGIIP